MTDSLKTERLESVSIILPVMNETTSLRQTVETILGTVERKLIRELLVVVCSRTTSAARETIKQLEGEHGALVVVVEQRLPYLGGALRDGFEAARGSHVIMMASDLETNPEDVQRLIAEEAKNPSGIVTTSRWVQGGSFSGYSKIKLICNWVFQRFFSVLYGTRLSDMTFGYRILPTKLAQAIQWEEVRHPFNLESVIKPLRLGIPVSEISSTWRSRREGESQNPFFRNFEFFRIGLKVLFARKDSLLRGAGRE